MSKATGETEHLKEHGWSGISWRSPDTKSPRRNFIRLCWTVSLHFPQEVFWPISLSHNSSEQPDLNFRLWDFLFYASFGFVVTSSVAIAGVLLVFCYFDRTSVGAMLFADRIGTRLAMGGTMGTSGLGARLLFFGVFRPAHGSDYRLYLRSRIGLHGSLQGHSF